MSIQAKNKSLSLSSQVLKRPRNQALGKHRKKRHNVLIKTSQQVRDAARERIKRAQILWNV